VWVFFFAAIKNVVCGFRLVVFLVFGFFQKTEAGGQKF